MTFESIYIACSADTNSTISAAHFCRISHIHVLWRDCALVWVLMFSSDAWAVFFLVLCGPGSDAGEANLLFCVCFADRRWRLLSLVPCKTSTIAIHLTHPPVREQPWIQVLTSSSLTSLIFITPPWNRKITKTTRCSTSFVANASACSLAMFIFSNSCS